MINAIYASRSKTLSTDIIEIFQQAGICITPIHSGAMVLSLLSDAAYDLLITDDTLADMSGRTLIEKSLSHAPFMNCAVMSRMRHDLFHEEFEGLGVLMQLPEEPGADDVHKLMTHIQKVSNLLENPKQQINKGTCAP